MKIKALKNFGHQGAQVEPGTILDVNPDDFGGTFEDFKSAGLFEEVVEPASAKSKKPAGDTPATSPAEV